MWGTRARGDPTARAREWAKWCVLCGAGLVLLPEQQSPSAPFDTLEEHFPKCSSTSLATLRHNLLTLGLEKEMDYDPVSQTELPVVDGDLMSLVLEREVASYSNSNAERVRTMGLLLRAENQSQKQASAIKELLQREQEEEEMKSALPCGQCRSLKKLNDLHFLECCPHHFCLLCLKSHVQGKLATGKCADLACPQCRTPLTQAELKLLLTPTENDDYLRLSVQEVIASSSAFIVCPNKDCEIAMEKIPFTQAGTGPKDQPLEPKALNHQLRHRFRCRECSTEFCDRCGAVPYHAARTCKQFAHWLQAQHCRFCGNEISMPTTQCQTAPTNISGQIGGGCESDRKGKQRDHSRGGELEELRYPNCCEAATCRERASRCCVRTLTCGHTCYGVRDETDCLPCLHPACGLNISQKSTDNCAICYVEELAAGPCLQLSCGHIFHFECLQKKIQNGWPGSRITFGYLACPLCNSQIRHTALQTLLEPALSLYQQVQDKALQRLKMTSLDKCEAITSRDSPFFQDPIAYSLHRFSYYLCFKCKKPYFGGDKACNAGERLRDFNPEELVCGGCCSLGGQSSCAEHGVEYIEYKCRYCCNVAVWFCWGTTHFCDSCHKNAAELITASKKNFPKCTCGNDHPPNGEEFSLGCSLCRASRS